MVIAVMVFFPGKKPPQPESSRATETAAQNLAMTENRRKFNILPSRLNCDACYIH
jgi:hypothetical protein